MKMRIENKKLNAEKSKVRIKNKIILYSLLLGSHLMLLSFSFAAASTQGLEKMLREFIRENYPWHDVQITGIEYSADTKGALPEKVRVEKGCPGKTVFMLEFSDGRRVSATADVKALEQVVMSRNSFSKSRQIEEEDVYMTTMEASRVPRGAVREMDDAVGKTLNRSVFANKPLTESMLKDGPVVKKGQRVTLFVEAPFYTITAQGELRETSYVGSTVKVMNLSSKKTITGMLVDENTVRVEF